jgi:mediator of RNA polymerase II transcription subunit 17
MSEAESLKEVTLRPWPPSKKQELSRQDLLDQIEQLTNERGHLRGITEKSLQEDIDAGKDVSGGAMEGLEQEKEEKPAQSKEERLQHVFRAQQEMASHLEYGLIP